MICRDTADAGLHVLGEVVDTRDLNQLAVPRPQHIYISRWALMEALQSHRCSSADEQIDGTDSLEFEPIGKFAKQSLDIVGRHWHRAILPH
jgi:hypothetical protein